MKILLFPFNLDYNLISYVILFCRCGAQQSGDLGSSSSAVDGILGFGQSNSSMISQLASSGKVRKIFAHCLDTVNGGGIFAIGHVVQPKVNTTPLVPDQYVLMLLRYCFLPFFYPWNFPGFISFHYHVYVMCISFYNLVGIFRVWINCWHT